MIIRDQRGGLLDPPTRWPRGNATDRRAGRSRVELMLAKNLSVDARVNYPLYLLDKTLGPTRWPSGNSTERGAGISGSR